MNPLGYSVVEQIKKYQPKFVCVEDEVDAINLQQEFPHIKVLFGEDGLLQIADIEEVDGVISFSFEEEQEVSVDNEECVFGLISRLNDSELLGVSVGTIVYCYDGVGRLLWRKECVGNSLTFDTPNGLYVLRIIDGENVRVIKGI